MAKFLIFLSCVFLWGISHMIIQFNLHYPTFLLQNKIQVGEIPSMAYLGLFAGILNGLLVWGLIVVIVKLTNKFLLKTYSVRKIFINTSIVFFVFVLLSQGGTLYQYTKIKQEAVDELRKSVEDYRAEHPEIK